VDRSEWRQERTTKIHSTSLAPKESRWQAGDSSFLGAWCGTLEYIKVSSGQMNCIDVHCCVAVPRWQRYAHRTYHTVAWARVGTETVPITLQDEGASQDSSKYSPCAAASGLAHHSRSLSSPANRIRSTALSTSSNIVIFSSHISFLPKNSSFITVIVALKPSSASSRSSDALIVSRCA
jgi:hypothetical protein